MKKIEMFFILLFASLIPIIVYAIPSKPGNFNSASNVTHTGDITISSDTEESDKTYTSSIGGRHALFFNSGTSKINNPTIDKTGDSDGDEADFYGINAAVFAHNGANVTINGGNIKTNGAHANAIFSYSTGIINLNDSIINTISNNSGGVMVTGGGTLNANNLTVKTMGNSSAAIRSDRGGGTLNVEKGSYETNGVGSPVIYSTANVSVKDAVLTSNSSEGVVIEGFNSVSLNNVKLTDTNNSLNGNSETYKNIFIYQSMSGDADEGVGTFTSKDSKIVTNKGDTFFVTNTKANISLENNVIENNDQDFLRIQASKWGNSGSNGGNVTMTLTNQKVSGNIIVDDISTLDLTIENSSVLESSINSENKSKNITLKIDNNSVLSLQNDTYITKLENDSEDNSNIYSNGKYKLYVNGNEVSINEEIYKENNNLVISKKETKHTSKSNLKYMYILIGLLIIIIILSNVIIIKKLKNKSVK